MLADQFPATVQSPGVASEVQVKVAAWALGAESSAASAVASAVASGKERRAVLRRRGFMIFGGGNAFLIRNGAGDSGIGLGFAVGRNEPRGVGFRL